jgi:ABC-type multidrug transport system fused ATPase/permease subunit
MWSRLFDLQIKGSWQPTYLVVSHRPQLLERADQIMRLDRGQIL